MSAAQTAQGASASVNGREVTTTRVYPATRDTVWEAWTRPEQVDRWWGPRAFTTHTATMDVRVGGGWTYTMHGMGMEFPNHIAYHEVVRPERLVYDHGEVPGGEPHFHVTVTFDEVDGGTRVTMRSLFPTEEALRIVVEQYGALEGGKETLDRLSEHLAST